MLITRRGYLEGDRVAPLRSRLAPEGGCLEGDRVAPEGVVLKGLSLQSRVAPEGVVLKGLS